MLRICPGIYENQFCNKQRIAENFGTEVKSLIGQNILRFVLKGNKEKNTGISSKKISGRK